MRSRGMMLWIVACAAGTAAATPLLELSISGPAVAPSPGVVTITVNAANSDLGLGGLSYTLESSIAVGFADRSYSPFGWVANDGDFDNCDPAEGAAGANGTAIYFDTVFAPAGSERPSGSSGPIEQFHLAIPAGLSDGTILTLLLSSVQASNGAGDDVQSTLGGTISTSELQILVPEPSCLAFIGLSLATLHRRRRSR